LIALLSEWNIHPSAVVGHSSGEIAAAYAAGLLTAPQAIVAAYLRGVAVEKSSKDGAMLALGASSKKAQEILEAAGVSNAAMVACVNSPNSVTISGTRNAISTLRTCAEQQKTFCRALKTNGMAYHSPQMKEVGDLYEQLLQSHMPLTNDQPELEKVVMVSTVTRKQLSEFPGPKYWRRNLESPVLFEQGISELETTEGYHVLELGPQGTLQGPLKQCRGAGRKYSSVLQRNVPQVDSLLHLTGGLFLSGYTFDMAAVNKSLALNAEYEPVLCELPPYQWSRDPVKSVEPRFSTEYRHQIYAPHELLGSAVPGGDHVDHRWRNMLKTSEVPWLADHKVFLSLTLHISTLWNYEPNIFTA
jgi:acyl transferase domain-containing protein